MQRLGEKKELSGPRRVCTGASLAGCVGAGGWWKGRSERDPESTRDEEDLAQDPGFMLRALGSHQQDLQLEFAPPQITLAAVKEDSPETGSWCRAPTPRERDGAGGKVGAVAKGTADWLWEYQEARLSGLWAQNAWVQISAPSFTPCKACSGLACVLRLFQ